MARYGPPWYDISKRGTLNYRLLHQSAKRQPMMYSSHWHEFGKEVLRGNRHIKRELRNIANRALFSLKRTIPLGDVEDGHLRNSLKVRHVRRAGVARDRDGYEVRYTGENPSGWNAAVLRSTFPSRAAWKNASRGVEGPIPSWLDKAKSNIEKR